MSVEKEKQKDISWEFISCIAMGVLIGVVLARLIEVLFVMVITIIVMLVK